MEGFSAPSLISLLSKFLWLISVPRAYLTAGVAKEQGLAVCQGRERADFNDHIVVSASISRDIDSV